MQLAIGSFIVRQVFAFVDMVFVPLLSRELSFPHIALFVHITGFIKIDVMRIMNFVNNAEHEQRSGLRFVSGHPYRYQIANLKGNIVYPKDLEKDRNKRGVADVALKRLESISQPVFWSFRPSSG